MRGKILLCVKNKCNFRLTKAENGPFSSHGMWQEEAVLVCVKK